eukprot:g30887.t1
MIQTAQVGVGIAGREGRQAVNNSDFAIGQFRFLERLLLLHGRWNYRRACMFTLFTFWRNMVQVLMIVFYTFISGYSGTSLFEDAWSSKWTELRPTGIESILPGLLEDWIRLTFNGVCTMPILPPGCMDQDFREQIILKNPKQYQVGPNSEDLNSKKVAMTISVAVLHAFVIVVITLLAFPGLEIVGSGDYYTFGTICYTCLILDVNYRAIFLSSLAGRQKRQNNNSRSLTIWVALAAFLLYSVYLLVYTNWPWLCNKLTPNMFKVPDHMSASAYFWICIFIVPFTAFVYDTFFHWVYHTVIDPDRADRLRIKLENDEHSRSLLDCRLTSESSDEEMGSASEGEGLMARCGASEFESLEMMNWMNCDKVAYDTRVFSLAIAGGVVMELLALLCWSQSSSKNQERWINGEQGSSWLEDLFLAYPIGTNLNEVVNATKKKDYINVTRDGRPNERKITSLGRLQTMLAVAPTHDIKNPLLFYSTGPFYQNYNYYMKSEVYQELYGLEALGHRLKRDDRSEDRPSCREMARRRLLLESEMLDVQNGCVNRMASHWFHVASRLRAFSTTPSK